MSFRVLTTFSITGCRWLPYASITVRVSAPSTAASSGIGIGDAFVSDICTVHEGDKGFLQGLRGQRFRAAMSTDSKLLIMHSVMFSFCPHTTHTLNFVVPDTYLPKVTPSSELQTHFSQAWHWCHKVCQAVKAPLLFFAFKRNNVIKIKCIKIEIKLMSLSFIRVDWEWKRGRLLCRWRGTAACIVVHVGPYSGAALKSCWVEADAASTE